MANNVQITEGSGKTVATEDIGSAQYQKIKLFDGTAASTTALKVNADGSITASVYGSLGSSVIGTVPVVQSGTVISSISGAVLVQFAPVASFVSGVTSIITTTGQTSVLATAPGAQRNYVTQILVTNAGAVGTQVNIMDGPNVVYAGYAAASGGGFAVSFPSPFKQATLAQSLDVKAVTTTSITAAMSGFTGA